MESTDSSRARVIVLEHHNSPSYVDFKHIKIPEEKSPTTDNNHKQNWDWGKSSALSFQQQLHSLTGQN